jgi:acetyl-CoA carboxylase biotin carboxyl carrier protein
MTQTKKHDTVDIDVVRRLAEVLAETGLTEIEYATGDWRVRVVKTPAAIAAPAPAAPILVAKGAADKDGPPATEAEALADHPGLLTSPMVGVVYTSSEPAAASFVTVGDQVAAGDTVFLIEAMKVFNPIKAHRSGRVERVFVSSGMPVEFGEPLMLIV